MNIIAKHDIQNVFFYYGASDHRERERERERMEGRKREREGKRQKGGGGGGEGIWWMIGEESEGQAYRTKITEKKET